MNTPKILITGSTGFLGKTIVKDLELKNIIIDSLSRSPEFRQNKVNQTTSWKNLNSIDFSNYNSIIHCAAKVHQLDNDKQQDLIKYQEVNRDLTIKLAKYSLESGIKKFIFISTLAVFGRFTGGFIKNNSIPSPTDPYGISKWEAEQALAELFSRQSESQCIILRLPMIYGPENKGNMIPLLKVASKKLPLPLGCAKGKRSMIFSRNISNAIQTILEDKKENRPSVQTYFLNDGNDLTSGKLYSLIFREFNNSSGVIPIPELLFRIAGNLGTQFKKLTGKQLAINNDVISRLFDEYRFSSNEFQQDYNWSPKFTPKEGIKQTVDWYKEFFN